MKKLLLLTLLLCICQTVHAQYYSEHHIAPAPWQYWSSANELVVGTLSPVNTPVTVSKSDGTFITTLNVSLDNPVSYRFEGDAFSTALNRNEVNQTYTDRGLILSSPEPILVNIRNIASDATQGFTSLSTTNIKGNASLVSFGNEGLGREFRLGYYRRSTTGLFLNNVAYSVMAVEDNTTVTLPTNPTETIVVLNKGESRLFNASIGALLTADKAVVMNVGSWGDTPQTCGANGQDGTFDQIAPIHVLGNQYLVVRGDGTAPTANQQTLFYGSEQSLIVASQDETVINVQHFAMNGTPFGTPTTITLNNAGDFYTFYHGDGQNKYSASLINSDKPVIVYAGTAVGCETDISTVLPIGSCAGSTNIQTKKFIGYNNENLTYFGFTIIENPTIPVMMGTADLETLTGNNRIQLGNSGFYIITFDNTQINNPQNILLSSTMPLTSSLVQQGDGFSMSAFFSAFGEAAISPVVVSENENCTVTIEAQIDESISEYEWFLDNVSLGTTEENTLVVTKSGSYTVRLLKSCGWGNISLPTEIEVNPCSDLEIKKEVVKVENGVVTFKITAKNLDEIFDETNVQIQEILPSGYSLIETTVSAGTFDNNTLIWTIPDLPAGAEETLILKATIVPDGEYINKVIITGSNRDLNLDNNEATAKISPDNFSFTMEALEKEFHDIDEVIEYELIIKNKGQNTLENVQIVNDLLYNINPNTISSIAPDEEVIITANYRITEQDYILGEVTNQTLALTESVIGIVETLSDDPVTPELGDPTTTILNRVANVDVIKDNFQNFYRPGSSTDYTITITNHGPTTALNLEITDMMPQGIEEMSWKISNGLSGTGNINFIEPILRVNESITINSTVKIPSNYTDDLINTVNFSSDIENRSAKCSRCTDMDIEEVFIPRGISPNGDMKNDYLDLSRYHVAKLQIFNRYGLEIYSKNNYSKEWMGQTKAGKLAPSGIYFYNIIIVTGDIFTGWIFVNY